MQRKHPLVNGECYHVITRSIQKQRIFQNKKDYLRMLKMMHFYRGQIIPTSFSYFYKHLSSAEEFAQKVDQFQQQEHRVHLLTFCLMPTHIHLILQQNENDGIANFMRDVLNSYVRFFNIKYGRKGPLFEGRYRNILIESDEQLLHSTRYLHLNPTSAGYVREPEQWNYSSYPEYLGKTPATGRICHFNHLIEMNPEDYKTFVVERIDEQKMLQEMKESLDDLTL